MVSWVAQVPPSQICPTTCISEDLNLDEIDFMTLILQIEKRFDVEMTIEEVDRIETVKDAVDYISENLNKYAA